ncbi:F-box domain-containing protein [Favolaschia claudopus]|uniref:F-box domain-containing protein n=1 Tax=Favolaschia claudopus TaxID=2862362 RepID=A0AAW0EDK7_9AGAR
MDPPPSILSLPNELLTIIVVAGQHDCGTHTPTAHKSEWILSHVSRRFRNVVIGTPGLWTNIEVRFAEDSYEHRFAEVLKLYLQRSNPLTMNVSVSLGILDDGVATLAEWLLQVAPEINRIESLSVVLRSIQDDFSLEFAPLRHLAAPNLLNLEIINLSYIRTARCPLQLFSAGAPNLSSVRMDGFFPHPAPPWISSLATLKIDGEHFLEDDDKIIYLSMFQTQSLCLVNLSIDLYKVDLPPTSVRVPSLASLAISIDHADDDFLMWQNVAFFDCPALTQLTVVGTHGDQVFNSLFNAPGPRFKLPPGMSFPLLHTLSFILKPIDGCDCEDTEGMTPPTRTHFPKTTPFPALTSLILYNQCYTTHLVREMLMGTHALPWPYFKTLTLCPLKHTSDVRMVIEEAFQRSVPKLRLCPSLFCPENGVGA